MGRNIKKYLKNKDNDYSSLEKKFYKQTGKSFIFDNCTLDDLSDEKELLSTSIVIPAWNAEDTILTCLAAIEQSSFNYKYPDKLQVVITDDGSTDNTFSLIKNSKLDLNLTVVHQTNHGQGPAMNAAISVAEGDIIIEVDADTILNYFSIENLMCRHQFYKNALYTGFRYYVDANEPYVDQDKIKKNGPDSGHFFLSDERLTFPEPGWPNNMCIPSNHYKKLGNSKGLWMGNDDNDDPWILADMVFGMLFSLPRDIFNKIGGFDDRFEGWGCDDGYVGAKAVSEGVFVVPVYTATGFHISHPFRTADKQSEYDFNRKFFFDFINSTNYEGHPDWIAKANKRIKKRYDQTNKKSSSTPKFNVESKPLDADHLIAIGKYKEAFSLLNDKKSHDSESTLSLSKALIGLKMYSKAEKLLKSQIAKDPRNEDLLFQLFMTYLSANKLKEARKQLKILSDVNPDYPELVYWLNRDPQANFRQGVKYYKQGFCEVAKVCFEAALMCDPKNEEATQYREKCISKI